MPKRKRRQLSGGAKMRLAGKKAILLGVLPEIKALLQAAADKEMRPLTQFILHAAFKHARTILDQQ